jgi:hypothetical protein
MTVARDLVETIAQKTTSLEEEAIRISGEV